MRRVWLRAPLALALVLAGCAAHSRILSSVISPTGPCIQETVTGHGKHTHFHYWKNGVELNSTDGGDVLTAALGDFAPARAELQKADRVMTFGWVMLGVGLASFIGGLIAMVAAAPPPPPGQKGSAWLPGLGIAFGGEALGIASLVGAVVSSSNKTDEAIAQYNAYAAQYGCRN